MNSVTPERAEAIRRRQQSTTEIRDSLRELRIQLALLNYRVGSQLGLKDVDLDCLDILDSHGPLSPTALAKRAGVHPATMTGILDRLEKGGWVVRERDPADRRAKSLALTPRGRRTVDQVERVSQEIRDLVLGEVSDEDLARSFRLLETVRDRLLSLAEVRSDAPERKRSASQ